MNLVVSNAGIAAWTLACAIAALLVAIIEIAW